MIIVTWNSEQDIESCLRALSAGVGADQYACIRTKGEHTGSPLPIRQSEYEVILVDNHSQDETVSLAMRCFPEVRIIKNFYNAGLSRAINQGAGLARGATSNGKYILLLNPDVVVMEDTIGKLYQFMEQRKDVGACGPRFLWPTGKVQYSCREFPNFRNLFLEFTGIGRIKKFSMWRMGYFSHDSVREVEQPMGSCLLVRKEVFDKVGKMNENYPIFMNDVDLCFRIKEAGYKLYFLPDANVIHYLGSSTCKVKRKMILEEHLSIYRYLKSHSRNHFLIGLYGFLLLTSAFYRILFSFFLTDI